MIGQTKTFLSRHFSHYFLAFPKKNKPVHSAELWIRWENESKDEGVSEKENCTLLQKGNYSKKLSFKLIIREGNKKALF